MSSPKRLALDDEPTTFETAFLAMKEGRHLDVAAELLRQGGKKLANVEPFEYVFKAMLDPATGSAAIVACMELIGMATYLARNSKVLRAKACTVVLDVMEARQEVPAVSWHGCGVIWDIVHNSMNSPAFDYRAIEVVMKAMDTHKGNDHMLNQGCPAIEILASQSKKNRSRLIRYGAYRVLQEIQPRMQKMATSAIEALKIGEEMEG